MRESSSPALRLVVDEHGQGMDFSQRHTEPSCQIMRRNDNGLSDTRLPSFGGFHDFGLTIPTAQITMA